MPRVGVASPCIATRSSGSGLPRRTQRKATAPLLLAGNGAGTRLGSTGSAKSASNIRISTKLCRRHDGSRVGWAGTAFIRHDTKAVRIAINEDAHRTEERRVGKSVSVRVDLGGRRIIKKKKHKKNAH